MKRYEVSGFGVMEYEEVASTNSLAEKLPLSELKDKQVILTWRQTQGRGQATNRWESARKEYFNDGDFPSGVSGGRKTVCRVDGDRFGVSRFFKPLCRGGDGEMAERCVCGGKEDFRYPDRTPVAGAHIQSSLCGIGVNINQEQFLSDAPNPVSLFQLLGRNFPYRRFWKSCWNVSGRDITDSSVCRTGK